MSDQSSRFNLSSGEIAVCCFTATYMLVALVAALWRKNPEFAFYLIIMCILIAATAWVHWQSRLHIAALWGLSLWGMAHLAGGLMSVPASWPTHGDSLVLYNLWLIPGALKYDQLVHAFGFGLMTWISWQGIGNAFRKRGVDVEPTWGLLILCVASGMGFGAANEIVEFIATITLPSTNVGGYENTGWDLVANFVGCVIAAIAIRWRHQNR
jgi:hypothetical protein